MKVHYPKLYNMAHLLALYFTASKGSNNYFLLFIQLNNKQCRILTAFRTRNHRLSVEMGRWNSTPLNERLCHFCQDEVGDEFHTSLKCKFF